MPLVWHLVASERGILGGCFTTTSKTNRKEGGSQKQIKKDPHISCECRKYVSLNNLIKYVLFNFMFILYHILTLKPSPKL